MLRGRGVRQDPHIDVKLDHFIANAKRKEDSQKQEITEVDFILWFLGEYERVFNSKQSNDWAGVQTKIHGFGLICCWFCIIIGIIISVLSIELIEDESSMVVKDFLQHHHSNASYKEPTVTPLNYTLSGSAGCGTVEHLFFKMGALCSIPMAIMVHILIEMFASYP